MKDWFLELNQRERIFVAAAVVFVMFAAVWLGVWEPLDAGHKRAAEDVARWQNSLAELRPMKGQVQATANARPAATGQNQSLVVIVDNSLRQRGLYGSLQRSQPTPGGNGIRVEFESAAFDDLMLWLGDLHRQFGLTVQSGSFSVASSESPGRVNSSVTLER
ncbi:MAG: type II secretion system protein GspM [Woeseiaceae bacterium]